MLTLTQVAEKLGISRQTIYNKLSDPKTRQATIRELGAVRIFSRWKFDEDRIEQVLKNGTTSGTGVKGARKRWKRLGPIAELLAEREIRKGIEKGIRMGLLRRVR